MREKNINLIDLLKERLKLMHFCVHRGQLYPLVADKKLLMLFLNSINYIQNYPIEIEIFILLHNQVTFILYSSIS